MVFLVGDFFPKQANLPGEFYPLKPSHKFSKLPQLTTLCGLAQFTLLLMQLLDEPNYSCNLMKSKTKYGETCPHIPPGMGTGESFISSSMSGLFTDILCQK